MRRTALAILALAGPVTVSAQGLVIDHKEVKCIVAEKFPRFDACFNPGSEVARARVYFRGAGGPHWYFVDMKVTTPCFSTVIPKPKRTLKKMDYYVEVVDRGFAESRTAEYNPDIVTDEGQCRKDVPAAPFVQSASVSVGAAAGAPAVPAGFAAAGIVGVGGVSTAAVVAGVVGGGAAVAGGAIAIGGGGGGSTTLTIPSAPPTPPAPVVTPSPIVPTPGPTAPPSLVNLPPNAVFNINPDPPIGLTPLLVTFNLCKSQDPDGDLLRFTFSYGDGTKDQGSCHSDHNYTASFLTGQGGSSALGSPTAFQTSFPANACVDDRTGLEGHKICASYKVQVTPDCSSDTQGPTVVLTSPPDGSSYGDFGLPLPVPFHASASDNVGVKVVQYVDQAFYGPGVLLGGSNNKGDDFGFNWSPQVQCSPVRVVARATDVCGNVTISAPITVNMSVGGCGAPPPSAAARKVVWVSQLDVPGGRGQVILNGRSITFPGPGRAPGLGEGARGTNRIEAVLVEGRGEAGLWQFDLGESDVEAGSLAAVAGEVAEVTPQAITFRLKGQPGERVVFTFRLRP